MTNWLEQAFAGGSATVADDIAKVGVDIARVQGIKGVAIETADTLGVGEVWKKRGSKLRAGKVASPGHFCPDDYGAVGDGSTPDDAAFTAMFAAMNTAAIVYGAAASGSVQLSDNKVYYFEENLVIERGLSIDGVGGASVNATTSSRLKFAPGKCIWFKGNAGYDRGGSNGASMFRVGLEFQAVPSIAAYAHSHAYAAGDLIYLPHDHQFVYECLTAGTTSARPAAAWLPSHAYVAGDLVTPTVPDGHVYTVLVAADAGTSGATEPINWSFSPGSETTDGTVTWTEVPASAYFLDWADVALQPGVDIQHASTKWVAGATYEYNQVVRMPGVTASFFWLGPQGGVPTSGTAGAIPLTADVQGTIISDGLLDWTCYDAVSFVTTDGTAKFMPRLHCGIFVTSQCIIEDVQIGGTTSNYGLYIFANGGGRPSYNADFWQVVRVTGASTLNGFMRARSADAQAGLAVGCTAFGNFDGVHLKEWDRGFVDTSQAGNAWVGCASQGHGGYSFESGTTCQSTFVGCYSESYTPNRLRNGTVFGGVVGGQPVTTDTAATIIGSGGVGARNFTGYDTTRSATSGTIECSLAGKVAGQMPGLMSFAVRAGAEAQEQGLTWTTALPDYYGFPDGWHAWAYGPSTYGSGYVSYALAGDTATALRDDAIPTATMLIGRSGFYIGGLPVDDITNPATRVAALAVKWQKALPTTGKWMRGDTLYNDEPAKGGSPGWVCVTSGDFAATPPVFAKLAPIDATSTSYAVSTALTLADRWVTVTVTGRTMTLPASPVDGQTHSIRSIAAVSTTVDTSGGALNIDGAATATVAAATNKNFRYSSARGEWEAR
jgi:hypothetical protein